MQNSQQKHTGSIGFYMCVFAICVLMTFIAAMGTMAFASVDLNPIIVDVDINEQDEILDNKNLQEDQIYEESLNIQQDVENETPNLDPICFSTVNENREDATFKVKYFNDFTGRDNAPTESTTPKATMTVHYGYVDSLGVYHNDSLKALEVGSIVDSDGNHINTLYREARAAYLNNTCGNEIMFEQFAQEIYNDVDDKIYAYQETFAFATPDSSSAQLCTGLTRTANDKQWAYFGSPARGSTWQTITKTNNVDVYMVYRAVDTQNSSIVINNSSGEHPIIISCVLDDGITPLVGGITSAGTNKSNLRLTDFVNKHFIYNEQGDWGNKEVDYVFKEVQAFSGSSASAKSISPYITDLVYDNNYGWKTSTHFKQSGYTNLSKDNAQIKIVFEKVVPTLEASRYGIKTNMFDYDSWVPRNKNRDLGGISKFTNFKFGQNLDSPYDWSDSRKWGVTANKWSSTLGSDSAVIPDGYPTTTFKYGTEGYNPVRGDLEFLFNPTTSMSEYGAGYKTKYTNLDYFFDKKVYDETGHFYYSSKAYFGKDKDNYPEFHSRTTKNGSNFMSLDRLNKRFVKHTSASGANQAQRFMPFDYYLPAESNSSDVDYRKQIYDYMNGLTFDFDFIQPKDGKFRWVKSDGTVSEEDMIFRFDGDDDVYVYIDGVLVLDIGGRHQPLPGYINFRTGEVYRPMDINDNPTSVKPAGGQSQPAITIKSMFESAGRAGSVQWEEDRKFTPEVDPFEQKDYIDFNPTAEKNSATFKDYTRHHIKIFYNEHNEGDSNAMFDFNMCSFDSQTVQLGKERLPNGEISDHHEDYDYLVYQVDSTGKKIPYTGTYDVYEGYLGALGKIIETERPIEKPGEIHIKAGEVAVLSGFPEGSRYLIYEQDDILENEEIKGYKWNFTINDQEVAPEKFESIIYDNKTWYGPKDAISTSEWPGLQFQNIYNTDFIYDLKITRADNLINEKNTVVQVLFGQDKEKYAGTQYQIWKNGVQIGTGVLDENSCINGELQNDPNIYIIIPNIELGIPVTVTTYNDSAKQLINTYTSDQIDDAKQIGVSLEGKIPNNLSPFDKNLSTVILSLSENQKLDFVLSESTLDHFTQKFDMSATLYNNDGSIFNPGQILYDAVYSYYPENPIKVAIIDGKIQVATVDKEKHVYVYSNPVLYDGQYLTIYKLIPTDTEPLKVELYENIAGSYSPNKVSEAQTDKSNVTGTEVEFTKTADSWLSNEKISLTYSTTSTFVEAHIANILSLPPPTGFNLEYIFPLIALFTAILFVLLLIRWSYKLRKIRH